MTRMTLVPVVLAACCCLHAETPNIVLMLTDDQGYGDFGATGNHLIKTPHIDTLAAQSFSMTRLYVNPVCSPTRAALLTGRNSYRTGVTDTWRGRSTLREQEFTIAEMLKTKGYSTGLFGKWHLGDNYPHRPMEQGFDKAIYHQGGGLGQPSDPLENRNRYTDPILFDNGKAYQAKGYCCDIYYDEAIKWLTAEHKKGRPFFAYIATNTPHAPFHDVPEKWYEHYKQMDLSNRDFKNRSGHAIPGNPGGDTTARIYAMVSNIDDNVGKLTAALKALGIKNDTIIVYLTDNGPNGYRYVGGFRGKKAMITEGGIRSPGWFHWPARFKAGGSSDLLTAHLDLMPTLADLTGAELPKDRGIDGRSILPVLTGQDPTLRWDDRMMVFQWHRGDRPQRLRNAAVVSQNWKIEASSKDKMSLFDMRDDPYAMRDLGDGRPEVKQRMLDFYDQWLRGLDSEYPNMWETRHVLLGATDEEVFLTRMEMIFTRGKWHKPESLGYWNVNFSKTGNYDVAFQLATVAKHVKAKLLVDGSATQSKEFHNQQRMHFDAVEIAKGKVKLAFDITADGKRMGVWHAFVKSE